MRSGGRRYNRYSDRYGCERGHWEHSGNDRLPFQDERRRRRVPRDVLHDLLERRRNRCWSWVGKRFRLSLRSLCAFRDGRRAWVVEGGVPERRGRARDVNRCTDHNYRASSWCGCPRSGSRRRGDGILRRDWRRFHFDRLDLLELRYVSLATKCWERAKFEREYELFEV